MELSMFYVTLDSFNESIMGFTHDHDTLDSAVHEYDQFNQDIGWFGSSYTVSVLDNETTLMSKDIIDPL